MTLELLAATVAAWSPQTRDETLGYLLGLLLGLAELGDATASLALERFITRGETRELFDRNGL